MLFYGCALSRLQSLRSCIYVCSYFLDAAGSRSIALPSPPWNGVGTTIAGGIGHVGNADGPYRPSCPFALARIAFSTLSGVIGISSMRTPTASKIALVIAGGTGNCGPCPTSFAPNGPFLSGSSIKYVKTSHISSVVGLLYSRKEGNLWTRLRLPR